MSEFSFRYGDLSKGLYGSAKAIAQFIILPFILIIVASALMERGGSNSILNLDQTILGMRAVLIVFGAVLGVISFFYRFYPAGSISRLLFGEVRAGIVIGLGFVLLLGAGLHEAIKQVGPDLDLTSLFYLFAVLIGVGMLYVIGEWVDSRWAWRKRKAELDGVPFVPRNKKEPEDPKLHRVWHDFRFRYGRLTRGISMARGALLKYVILPVAAVIVLKAVITSMNTNMTDNLSGLLGTMMTLLFFVGIPIAVLSFFRGFYPKGSFSRLSFSIGIVALLDLWIWFATFQGRFQADMGNVHVDLNYQPYVLLIIIGVSLWAFYYVVELVSYRKDWIAQGFEPVDERIASERRSRDKALRKAGKDKERSE
jgi:hypothetical protein